MQSLALLLALSTSAPPTIDNVTISTIDEFADPDGEPKFVVSLGKQRLVRPLDGRIIHVHRLADRLVVITRAAPTVAATWTLEAFEVVQGRVVLVRRLHDLRGPDPIIEYRRGLRFFRAATPPAGLDAREMGGGGNGA